METNVKILGGLEITVKYTIQPAEREVGIMSAYVDDYEIVAVAGRPIKKGESTAWIETRIEKAEEDELICNACLEHYNNKEIEYYGY